MSLLIEGAVVNASVRKGHLERFSRDRLPILANEFDLDPILLLLVLLRIRIMFRSFEAAADLFALAAAGERAAGDIFMGVAADPEGAAVTAPGSASSASVAAVGARGGTSDRGTRRAPNPHY